MKLTHLVLLLMGIGLALFLLGCPSSDLPDLPAHVRFLNAMIPQGADSVSNVVIDNQTVLWQEMTAIGSVTQPYTVSAGHHRVQVIGYLNGGEGGRTRLTSDLDFYPDRSYTCVLTGEIPDSTTDSTSAAFLVPGDLHLYQQQVGIRLVNAALAGDTCDLVSTQHGDTILVSPIGRFRSSAYVNLPVGDYTFTMRGAADALRFNVPVGATGSYTIYYIGTSKYTQLPKAPHGLLLEDIH
jgi:hypothetical protein